MNARAIHAMVRRRMPVFVASAQEWINLVDSSGALHRDRLLSLANAYLMPGEVIAYANRSIAAVIPFQELSNFVEPLLLAHRLQIFDRALTCGLVIEVNGSATGWHRTQAPGGMARGTNRDEP